MSSLSDGEIAGIVIGALVGGVLVLWLLLYLLKIWLRGPTKGSDVDVNLENKVVVITGIIAWVKNITRYCYAFLAI